ncbi:SDR family NAD(P)-dependent oxidoreductase [Actinomadura viridis]|uniref:SDR family NAD(P)-dependent oxidoreductase n=1 Tax=Actinomadura viridis TaxID=58110 RepID=UPI0036D0D7D6
MRLEGKVALVTGAARRRGIGRGIAEALAAEGAAIAVNDVAAEDEARELVAELQTAGADARFYRADVTDRGAVEEMLTAIEGDLGPVQLVCSNAGIARFAPFAEIPESDFDAVVGVNLTGSFHVAQAAARRLVARGEGGRIVFTSSVHAQMPFPLMAIYGATKQAIRALTETLALELAPAGITVNHLGPGWVNSDLNNAVLEDKDAVRELIESIPAGRAAEPIEMGRAVAYLCSEDGAYVTGAYLRVDGGLVVGKY